MLEQLNYFNCNLTITCATKGSGRSKKKALKGKPGDKLVLPDSRDKAVRGMKWIRGIGFGGISG